MFLDHTQQRTTVSRTPLDEWSARRRDLYLTTHNTHNRQISLLPVGFEPTISAGERPQTYALDRAATGTGREEDIKRKFRGWRKWQYKKRLNEVERIFSHFNNFSLYKKCFLSVGHKLCMLLVTEKLYAVGWPTNWKEVTYLRRKNFLIKATLGMKPTGVSLCKTSVNP